MPNAQISATHHDPGSCLARCSVYITGTSSDRCGILFAFVPPIDMSPGIPFSHKSPEFRVGSTDEETSLPGFHPIAPEDTAELGVESRLIPFVISTALRAGQSPNGSPPLSPAEAENVVEILDKVRPPP